MDKKSVKHVLSGLSTAALITGVALTTSNCGKKTQEEATGCGQGSCSKANKVKPKRPVERDRADREPCRTALKKDPAVKDRKKKFQFKVKR